MDWNLIFIGFIVLVALGFDFTNGAHDAANSIATIVSTRVLSPRHAVIWAATFNFIAFAIFGTAVAKTLGKGLIDVNVVTPNLVLAGVMGAIAWNIITWVFALPTSSSHALIGGYVGAAVAKAGWGVIIPGGWTKTLVFIVVAPLIGAVLGVIFITIASWVIHKKDFAPAGVNKWSKRLQLFSAAIYSLGHGGNDAQKTMGIITGLLFSVGYLKSFDVPMWVVLSAHGAIAIGTLFGGWRIIKTMGQKIVKLRPIDGVCAETASAMSLFLATYLAIPVSTTHVITGAISGVGAAKRVSSVRWDITFRIVQAWIFTIPCAALLGALIYWGVSSFG
ncbi:MAG: inorganic phosphate transporter [Candidatus Peregrinibacteria bacterium]|nr:inorganic phosphate transporter [Candidatus Peregrinibacteria bacterium]